MSFSAKSAQFCLKNVFTFLALCCNDFSASPTLDDEALFLVKILLSSIVFKQQFLSIFLGSNLVYLERCFACFGHYNWYL